MKQILGSLLCCGICAAASAAQRPDLILIMVDDMGYSDLGCCCGEISKPNKDDLARQGVRFFQFDISARCCARRLPVCAPACIRIRPAGWAMAGRPAKRSQRPRPRRLIQNSQSVR